MVLHSWWFCVYQCEVSGGGWGGGKRVFVRWSYTVLSMVHSTINNQKLGGKCIGMSV